MLGDFLFGASLASLFFDLHKRRGQAAWLWTSLAFLLLDLVNPGLAGAFLGAVLWGRTYAGLLTEDGRPGARAVLGRAGAAATAAALLGLVFLPGAALAQQVVEAKQGQPGTKGAWPVSVTAITPGTATFLTMPASCSAVAASVCSVTTAAAATCPAAQLANRRYLMFCSSAENTSGQLIKINPTGTQVVLGVGNAGLTLTPGDCVAYPLSAAATVPSVRSNAAGGADLQVFQCASTP